MQGKTYIKLSPNFSAETLHIRRDWNVVLKVLKERKKERKDNCQPKLHIHAKSILQK